MSEYNYQIRLRVIGELNMLWERTGLIRAEDETVVFRRAKEVFRKYATPDDPKPISLKMYSGVGDQETRKDHLHGTVTLDEPVQLFEELSNIITEHTDPDGPV